MKKAEDLSNCQEARWMCLLKFSAPSECNNPHVNLYFQEPLLISNTGIWLRILTSHNKVMGIQSNFNYSADFSIKRFWTELRWGCSNFQIVKIKKICTIQEPLIRVIQVILSRIALSNFPQQKVKVFLFLFCFHPSSLAFLQKSDYDGRFAI